MSMKQRATTCNKTPVDAPAMMVQGKFGKPRDRERLVRFFSEYVKSGNAREAGRLAGFSEKWCKQYSYTHLKRNEPYIAWLRAQVATETAKQIAIELEPVLQELATIAFANEADYLVIEEQAGGAPSVRRKRLDELTRQQMVAIRVFRRPDGSLDYTMRNKEARLIDLGKHLGAFNEKLILEHRHAHMHAHIDLTQASQADLDELESKLERVIERLKGKTLEHQK